MIPYGERHSVAVSWSFSINGLQYLSFTFTFSAVLVRGTSSIEVSAAHLVPGRRMPAWRQYSVRYVSVCIICTDQIWTLVHFIKTQPMTDPMRPNLTHGLTQPMSMFGTNALGFISVLGFDANYFSLIKWPPLKVFD